MSTRDERIRLLFEAAGLKDADAFVRTLQDMEAAGGETAAAAKKLGDELDQIAASNATVNSFERLSNALAATNTSMQAAQAEHRKLTDQQEDLASAVDRTGLRLKLATQNESEAAIALRARADAVAEAKKNLDAYRSTVDANSDGIRSYTLLLKQAKDEQRTANAEWRASSTSLKAATKDYNAAADAQEKLGNSTDTARKRAELLADVHRDQGIELARLSQEMQSAGIDARNLADAQDQLRARTDGVVAAAREQAAAVEAQARANAELKARLADTDASFNRQTKASRTAAEALRDYRARAEQAKNETKGLGDQSDRTSGVFGRLRGAIAGVGAYLGLREALQGAKNLLGLGDATERVERQFARLFGGIEKGRDTLARIRQIAADTGQDYNLLREAAAKLMNFGIDPLNGSLQAMVDQNAAVGGSQEDLEGKILAVGQAWAKQKLQGEEILQLVERGVPVWSLLEKATGKNVTELQKLSEQGKLGRDVMKALLDEIGKANSGAAAESLTSLTGLLTTAKNTALEFLQSINDKGVLDYFKSRLAALNDEVKRLAADGTLKRYAKDIADAIIATARGAEAAAQFVATYAKEIIALAAAYGTLKAAQTGAAIANSFLLLGNGAKAAAGPITTLAKSVRTLGVLGTIKGLAASAAAGLGGMVTAIGALGVAVAGTFAAAGFALADTFHRLRPAIREANAALEASREETRLSGEAAFRASLELQKFADVSLISAAAAAKLGVAERDSYLQRVQGLEAYTRERARYLNSLKAQGLATAEQLKEYDALREQLKLVTAHYTEVGKAVSDLAVEAEALKRNNLSAGAQKIVDSLGRVDGSAASAAEKVEKLFENFSGKTWSELGDLALALAHVSDQSGIADRNIRDGLSATLAKLTGEDLLRFANASQYAFDTLGKGAEDAAAVSNTVLLVALQKLGVEGENLGVGITKSGRDILATFETVASSAAATGAQIEAAFKAAVGAIATREEAQALGAALEVAGQRGKIGLEAAERAAAALRARVREIEEAADPLADAFERLGVTSQRALQNTADTAREAFDEIVAGAQRGEAATEDVRRAFVAYAQAQLDAVKNSDAWERAQVESMIRVRAQALGVVGALDELGLAGEKAGQQVASGADTATDALRGTAAAAEGAAAAAGQLAGQTNIVSQTFITAGNNAAYMGGQVQGASQKFNELLLSQSAYSRGSGGQLYKDFARQSDELERQIAALQEQNMQYDELGQRILTLRGQYQLLSDDRLRQLAQEQMAYEENQRRAKQAQLDAAAERARKIDENNRRRTDTDGDTTDRRVAQGGLGDGRQVNPTIINFGELSPAQRRALSQQIARDIQNELNRNRDLRG